MINVSQICNIHYRILSNISKYSGHSKFQVSGTFVYANNSYMRAYVFINAKDTSYEDFEKSDWYTLALIKLAKKISKMVRRKFVLKCRTSLMSTDEMHDVINEIEVKNVHEL